MLEVRGGNARLGVQGVRRPDVRVWDVPAGYLNRQSLLGEHRELHGVYSIICHRKRGYARHPETLRWVGALTGLAMRHALLVAEMQLRGYVDRTPLVVPRGAAAWPGTFVTDPADQFLLLRRKYFGLVKGRIPLPRNAQELWAHHKYSVMARDPAAYRRMGRLVAGMSGRAALRILARDLVAILRIQPSGGRLVNAIEHMWGHVVRLATPDEVRGARRGAAALLACTQALAVRHRERFLLASTALSDLAPAVDAES